MPIFVRLLRRWRLARLHGAGVRARRSLSLLFVYLALIFVVHIAAMVAFEKMSIGDAAWLTATTVTTVGYGDVSAATPMGRLATVVLLYIGGIFVVAKAAGDYFEYRAEQREQKLRGQWRWNLRDHVVIVNAPESGAVHYFETFATQLRATGWGTHRAILIVSDRWSNGLPEPLQRLGIVHVDGRGDDPSGLESADVPNAAAIVVLADDRQDARSDAMTFDVIHRIRAISSRVPIFAEAVLDENRDRLRRAGANAVVRPSRSYPEMMVRAIVAPGSEAIMENLFSHLGDECVRYDVPVTGVPWARLVSELVARGIGIPLAYHDAENGDITCNPPPDRLIRTDTLFVIVKEGVETPPTRVREILAGLAA